ncbi:MAG: biopolymer transporter ExbD [Halobacteriovoraceae bacterium]|nr:biopolymer transporter ExbD [Halobacteriovoraceae bacterium]
MKKRSRESVSPEITPLIDVVFLLLIFFMVSTVFKKDELALLLNLPKTSKGEGKSRKQKSLRIELTASEVAYNGQKVSLAVLDDKLAGVQDKTTSIELRIDKNVVYKRIVDLLDKLKNHKLINLELITEQ